MGKYGLVNSLETATFKFNVMLIVDGKPPLNIGDKVKITRSNKNWSSSMNKFDGKIVTIRQINTTSVRFVEQISELNDWSWVYADDHFVLHERGPEGIPKMKIRINF